MEKEFSEGHEEQRRHPRFQSRKLVRFLLENGEEVKSISKIINVSQGGLQFACRDRIAVDTILRMDIPDSQGVQFSLKARVVWINPAPDVNGLFYSGVSFLDMKDDMRALILKAIT